MKSRKKETTEFCVQRLRVLADPARLAVLEILMKGPKRVGELKQALGIEQSLLSHHLKILRDQGFVKTDRDGKSVIYRMATEAVSLSKHALSLGCCTLSFETKLKSVRS